MKHIFFLILAIFVFYVARMIYMRPKYFSGDSVENFNAELLNGKRISLETFKNNYLFIDFWGSWCGPCRKENPFLVKIYQDFHNKKFIDAENFEILSVGIETNVDRWKNAITKDNLFWENHVYQGKSFDSDLAIAYKVREIPTKYLLDQKGKVILTNPSFEELVHFLNSKLVSPK
jgi:thiol-disulfide isomerase/thioredoxin